MTIRGPILIPRDGGVDFLRDGVLASDESGNIAFVGAHEEFVARCPNVLPSRDNDGIILPPFLDAHIHIPQHPIRGHFMDGVEQNPPGGRLLAGLNRNVFPAEAQCAAEDIARQVVRNFLGDTLSKGVVGGAAYMSVHASAVHIALENLPDLWQAGMVLMNQNCPQYLRTDEPAMERDTRDLHARFGGRVVVTDRFAVAVDSPLRRRAAALANEFGLRMQTHLNEQIREKDLVERTLYPQAGSYANVYEQDGLLARDAMLAHCIHMRDEEWELIARRGAQINHCPVSNTLLGSGIMKLDRLFEHGIEYAICTDVGASPTTSLPVEMSQFLKVHRGRSSRATPSEALYRTTLGAAKMLHIDDQIGRLEIGRPMSFVEVKCEPSALNRSSVDDVILAALLETSNSQLDEFAQRDQCRQALAKLDGAGLDIGPDLDCLSKEIEETMTRLENKVSRVTLAGKAIWERK